MMNALGLVGLSLIYGLFLIAVLLAVSAELLLAAALAYIFALCTGLDFYLVFKIFSALALGTTITYFANEIEGFFRFMLTGNGW